MRVVQTAGGDAIVRRMARRTLVVHAADVLARAHQSVTVGRQTADGRPTNALLGAIRTLRRALAFKEPAHAVAVLPADDGWAPPGDLAAQAARWPEVLEAHGLPVVRADHAAARVAGYVAAALAQGNDVVVVGSDKRLGQLVREDVWWYEGHKDVRFTPEALRKRYGVPPSQLADWFALVGLEDSSGAGVGVPGVPGIGAKGAVGLLEAYGSVEAALAQVEALSGRAGKALREGAAAARDSLRLARLPASPDGLDLADLVWRAPSRERLNALYRDLELYQLLAAEGPPAAEVQVRQCASAADVEEVLAAIGDRPAAVYALTEPPSPVRGALVGVAVAWAPDQAAYVPAAHCAALASWAGDPARPKLGHDLKAAEVALRRQGLPWAGTAGDVLLAAHLEDPAGMAYGLGQLARQRLQRALPRVPDAWSAVSEAQRSALAAGRAAAILELWAQLAPGLPDDALEEPLALADTLVRMELHGVPCDAVALEAAGRHFAAREAALTERIHRIAGHPFLLSSNQQLGQVLYEELGLPVLKRTKTGWSVASDVLERLRGEHEIVGLVIAWRQLRRLQDGWVHSLGRAIGDDGRIHSTLHPARSFSGRLVNTEPDLGRVPGRTEEMARIRQAFRAPEGWALLSVDYTQLGLYVLAHLTEDPALVEPLEGGGDLHRATAAAVLDKAEPDVTPEERQLGKVVNFATFAGQGASALALQLGVSAKDAKRLIARFDRRYARTRAFQDAQLERAQAQGYVETLAGRRWRIADLASLDLKTRAYAERMARRARHEGSVADVTRRGLRRADRALRAAGSPAQPLLQVHDEILFEVPHDAVDETVRLVAPAMEGAFQLRVPLRVTAKAGPSWGDLVPW